MGRVTGRRSQKKSGFAGVVAGLLPTRAASKATPSSKTGKLGGLAALTAAAGVAFRNRDKLSGLVGRGEGQSSQPPVTTPAGETPVPTTPAGQTPPATTVETQAAPPTSPDAQTPPPKA